MKNKTKIFLTLAVAGICLFAMYYSKSPVPREADKIVIEYPEEIAKLQFNTIRLDRKDYPEDKLKSLLNHIENLVPTERVTRENQDFLSIILLYGNGEKEVYLFFEDQEQWYMETSDGQVYQDADFILDYLNRENVTVTAENGLLKENLTLYIEVLKNQSLSEMDRELYVLTKKYESSGVSEESAIDKAKKELDEREKLFIYAKKNQIYPSEERQQELMETYLSEMKTSKDYASYEENCAAAGFTVEEIVALRKQSLIELEISHILWNEKRLDYMKGDDRIGDKIYDDFQEYYRAFLREYVYEKQDL